MKSSNSSLLLTRFYILWDIHSNRMANSTVRVQYIWDVNKRRQQYKQQEYRTKIFLIFLILNLLQITGLYNRSVFQYSWKWKLRCFSVYATMFLLPLSTGKNPVDRENSPGGNPIKSPFVLRPQEYINKNVFWERHSESW